MRDLELEESAASRWEHTLHGKTWTYGIGRRYRCPAGSNPALNGVSPAPSPRRQYCRRDAALLDKKGALPILPFP
jgi:hypothetical protein